MATWKKVVPGLLVLAVITIGGGITLLDEFTSDLCASTTIEQIPSPSGKTKAVVFQIDCGATSGFNIHVTIVSAAKDSSKKSALPKSFFAADSNAGGAPAGKANGPELRLTWLSDSHLEIQHHEQARVIRAEKSSNGVAVDYRTFH